MDPQVRSQTCPDDEVLRAFMLGDLAEEVIEAVRRHQEACSVCEARAQALDEGSDQVLDELRRAIGRPPRFIDSEEAAALPDYQITGPPLGVGATGLVYPARHRKLGRRVALKTIARGSEALFPLFEMEARAVARLQHPNIVQIYDIGQHLGRPFLALEFVEGGSLRDRIRSGAIATREAVEFIRIVATAVHHAHEQGIVHCDLKPSNILITREGVPKVADFGAARWTESNQYWSEVGDPVGTPRYMAPEQLEFGGALGRTTDVYSLGVILHEMLVGRVPDPSALALGRLNDEIPRQLQAVIRNCLHRLPTNRYPDARALSDGLGRFLDGDSSGQVSTRPTSWRSAATATVTAAAATAGCWWFMQNSSTPAWMGSARALIAQDDGSFRLGAAAAQISGASLKFEDSFGNLGYWHGRQDCASWSFRIDRPGKFRVALEYANRNGQAGNHYEVQVDGASFIGEAQATAGWSDYQRFAVGEVPLGAGVHILQVRPAESLNGALFDLRAVVLQPVKP